MAKNIDFMGATFPDVPSIRLPQHEGGLVSFTDVTDTTAIASDVASGKYFYTADGTKTAGTASGGITPSGTYSITSNGTYDVTQYASADVNVSGGGGGSSYTLLASQDIEITGVTSTAQTFGTITLDERVWESDYIIYVRIRDKAGVQRSHCYGYDYWFVNNWEAYGRTDAFEAASKMGVAYYRGYSGSYLRITSASGNISSGIYLSPPTATNHSIKINAKRNSNVETIDGTFAVDVYALKWPDDISPFVPIV